MIQNLSIMIPLLFILFLKNIFRILNPASKSHIVGYKNTVNWDTEVDHLCL